MMRSIGATGVRYSGLSTDDKPLVGPEEGAEYRIVDTGEIYIYHDGMWELDLGTENDFLTQLTTPGTWDNPWLIGTLRMWYDSVTDVIRVRRGSNPAYVTNGDFLMESE